MGNLAGLLAAERDPAEVGAVRSVSGGTCVVDVAGETIRAAFPPESAPEVGEQVVIQRTRAGNFIVGRGVVRSRAMATFYIKE